MNFTNWSLFHLDSLSVGEELQIRTKDGLKDADFKQVKFLIFHVEKYYVYEIPECKALKLSFRQVNRIILIALLISRLLHFWKCDFSEPKSKFRDHRVLKTS